jgi:hypothetical protein
VRLLLPALVLVAAARSVAGAHEHMPIASTAPGGGSLVLAYDFSRQSVVAPGPGAGEYSGDDPGFNALLADDPAAGLYRLKDGTHVSAVLVARDPEVTMAVSGKELRDPGDKVQIGSQGMPYLHIDVAWTLTLPSGVTGYYQVSFRITASGYGQSPVYTDTVTNIVQVTTTTTVAVTTTSATTGPTMPGETSTTTTVQEGETTTSTTAGSSVPGSSTSTTLPGCGCEDDDRCTNDVCASDGCRHLLPPGAAAASCRLDALSMALETLPSDTRAERRLAAKLRKMVQAAGRTIERAGTKRRALDRAAASLRRFVALVGGKQGARLDAGVAGQLTALARQAQDQIGVLRQGIGR